MYVLTNVFSSSIFLTELTPEQQKLLLELRRRRQELLLEIQVIIFQSFYIKKVYLLNLISYFFFSFLKPAAKYINIY